MEVVLSATGVMRIHGGSASHPPCRIGIDNIDDVAVKLNILKYEQFVGKDIFKDVKELQGQWEITKSKSRARMWACLCEFMNCQGCIFVQRKFGWIFVTEKANFWLYKFWRNVMPTFLGVGFCKPSVETHGMCRDCWEMSAGFELLLWTFSVFDLNSW